MLKLTEAFYVSALRKVLATTTKIKHRLVDQLVDRANRIQTVGRIEAFELDLEPRSLAGAHAYQAVPYLVLKEIFTWLKMHNSSRTLVDLGSGKGRVLYVAHCEGMKRLVGIEHSPSMCLSAQFNLSTKPKLNFEIQNKDVREAAFPKEESVYFLNNPFGNEVLRPVAQKLLREAHPKSIIAFVNPLREHIFTQAGFVKVAELPSHNHNYTTSFLRRGS